MNAVAETITRYWETLQIRGLRDRTLETYGLALRRFRDFLEARDVVHLSQLTEDLLRAYRRETFYRLTGDDRLISPARQNVLLAPVRGWLEWLFRQGHLPRDLRSALPAAKDVRKLPREWLTLQEVERLLAAPDVRRPVGLRNRAIIEVLYSTGVRNSELCGIAIAHLHLEDGLLRVVEGKGGKDRVIPIGRAACHWVRTYLERARPALSRGDATSLLFLTVSGRPMIRQELARIVRRIAQRAHLQKPVAPHVLRHTFAAHMLRNNAPLRHIQEMLGHDALSTTERYLRITVSDLKQAHRSYHPREQAPLDPVPVVTDPDNR